MFGTVKKSLARARSAMALSESPFSTIEKRMMIIEKTMMVFGWATQTDHWRPNVRLVLTSLLLMTSLTMDAEKIVYMMHNRSQYGIQDIVELTIYVVTQSVCLYRIYLVVRYREMNRSIIRKLTVDFCEWMRGEGEAVMRKASRSGWFLFWVDTMILSLTAVLFVIRASMGHTFPIPSAGIHVPYVDNQSSPYYEIVFCLQMWIVSAQIYMALAVNNMFCSLAVMICGHLECLSVDVNKLNNPELEVDQILDGIIKKYIKIYEVVQDMNRLYGTVLTLQPLYTGAVIVASTLLYDGSQKSNVFFQISFDHIVELFIYCYIGNLVSEKSYELSNRLYACDWIRMSDSNKKTILQMMHRSQKAFTLNAGLFGPLTIEMYSKSIYMTYSMWNVFQKRTTY